MRTLWPHAEKIFSLTQILLYLLAFHHTCAFCQKIPHRTLLDQIIFPDPLLISRQRIAQRIDFCKQLHEAYIKNSTLSAELKRELMYGYFEASRINNAHDASITKAACSPDGQNLVSADVGGVIHFWKFTQQDNNLICHQTAHLISHLQYPCICDLAFSPDSQYLAAARNDHCITIWKAHHQNGYTLHQTVNAHDNWVKAVAFSPDAHLLASGSNDKTIKIWNFDQDNNLTLCQTVLAHTSWITSLVFSLDGQFLLSGSDDRALKIWKVPQNRSETFLSHRYSFIAHNGWISSVIISPDGQFIASSSIDRSIKLWNFNLHNNLFMYQLLRTNYDWSRSINFSPDGKYIASAGDNETLNIFMQEPAQTFFLLQTIHTAIDMRSIIFLPHSPLLLLFGSKSIILYKPYWTLLPEQTATLVSLYEKDHASPDKLSAEEQELLHTIPQGAWPEKLRPLESALL